MKDTRLISSLDGSQFSVEGHHVTLEDEDTKVSKQGRRLHVT